MIGAAKNIVDEIRQEQFLAEWKQTSSTITTHKLRPLQLSSMTKPTSESPTTFLTSQITSAWTRAITDSASSHIHWASFSTGLSLVLAVLVALALATDCCYFRGRLQQQSRARHTEVLCSIVAGANHTVSSHQRTQSGAYLGSSSPGPVQVSRFYTS